MSQKSHLHKRKQLYIKKDFQAKFILKFCMILLIGAVVSTTLLLFFSQDTLTTSFDNSKLNIKSTSIAILPAVLYTNIITSGIIVLAAIYITLFISHKIAGPMFRIEEDIKTVTTGDLTKRILLRRNDQIGEMAENINIMVSGIHKKMAAIQTNVDDLLESGKREKIPNSLIEQINKIQKQIDTGFKI